jgi:hypothetical protein
LPSPSKSIANIEFSPVLNVENAILLKDLNLSEPPTAVNNSKYQNVLFSKSDVSYPPTIKEVVPVPVKSPTSKK